MPEYRQAWYDALLGILLLNKPMIKHLLVFTLLTVISARQVHAAFDPLSVPNNRYGMHVADPNNIVEVAALVNTNGGDWGYVTVVIQENDRNVDKWQGIFNEMRRHRLIPLVRIATYPENGHWALPDESSFHEWVDFFGKLNWVIENRYIILWNEPNHSAEWGGTIDPEGYGKAVVTLGSMLHSASSDYFILPGGMDASAANNHVDMDAAVFIPRMIAANPEFLSSIDGWTSHSYPNPAFSGSPTASGKGTIRSFEWEIAFLREYGLNRRLPIFITETGWVHAGGVTINAAYPADDRVATYIREVAQSVWNHPDVVAVTPFVYSYQEPLFAHFSWKKFNTQEFYPQYFSYRDLSKTAGLPPQLHKLTSSEVFLPLTLVSGSTYTLITDITNNGQSIINPETGYTLTITDDKKWLTLVGMHLPTIEPGQSGKLAYSLSTPTTTGLTTARLSMSTPTGDVTLDEHITLIVPPPTVRLRIKAGWQTRHSFDNLYVELLDQSGTVIRAYDQLTVTSGVVDLPPVTDVIPNTSYTARIRLPYYLPQTVAFTLDQTMSDLVVPRLLPLDVDNDAQFTVRDLTSALMSPPSTLLGRFISL